VPCQVFAGAYGGARVTLVQPGRDAGRTGVNNVGTAPAALAAFLATHALKPDLLVNAGTAGGFARQGGAIGDAYVVSAFANHDRRIPIPGYTEYGIGRRDGAAAPNLLAACAGWKSGVCSSGNALDCSAEDAALLEANDACVKDMEGAAIAWACGAAGGPPVLALKVVTDIVDGDKPTEEEFLANLGTAAGALQAAVPKLLDFVIGKTLAEL